MSSPLLGCYLIALESKNAQVLRGHIGSGLVGIAFLFLAAYLVAEAVGSEVVLAPDTVSLRSVWGTQILARNEILGVKIVWRSGIAYITLQPKSSASTPLPIARFYSFDETWLSWISSLPNLDEDHKLEVIQIDRGSGLHVRPG